MQRSKLFIDRAMCVALLTALLSACGSQDPSLSITEIPIYPNAIERESMSGQDPMFGALKAELRQYSTADSHDQVVAFYRSRLAKYRPEYMSHDLPAGRQTAITVEEAASGITVAVQEFAGEDQVTITFMRVGR